MFEPTKWNILAGLIYREIILTRIYITKTLSGNSLDPVDT